jgi:subtilisin family serine protease
MSSSTQRAVRTTACLAAATVCAGFALVPTLASSEEHPAKPSPVGPPTVKTVTLVTGDVVQVSTGTDGRQSVTLRPRPDGTIPQAAINQVHDHLYVVPTEAFGLLQANRLDRDLFDITALIDAEYDDASSQTVSVIVDYGKGRTAAAESRHASFKGAERTVTLPRLGITSFHADKLHARAFWADLTQGADAAGNPTALSDGAARVDLDGRVEVALEDSVPQIHAPEAWAAGYDGAGATVAILDTGYDPTHPDLLGRVVASENFTDDATVTDGNGHGTHVASTVGGSGAASNGLRKGVAPKTDLMVGKVLSDAGYGSDSWVLAGMVWAVNQGADVISMSLGGDTDDGTNPLSLAVNELSASSDSLFVIAAGNNGYNGPSTVTSPGSADAALTVGAVDVNDVMAGFSSRGPRFRNGALKPEVVAPGVDVTAARAAGTELGPVVDDYYTTISGTSMATPHVAGLAAIVKEEHPDWDGERIKSVIANSTVPIANATGFDAGTGRVDALLAIQQDVVAPASLSLGSYAWPYSDLEPTSTALTYTNTGDTPVTLSLVLTGQDGSAEPTGSMTLAADQVTVPAGGTSSVDVVLDPTVADPGAYSAVVTATPDDGGGTVRTGLSYLLEPEAYDVTVTIKPRVGTQAASHQLGLSGFGAPWVYEQRSFDALPGAQSATFRVPPGTYGTAAISFGLAGDGAKEGVVTYEPSFTVNRNTQIMLDENETGRFRYQVDRPVVDDGAILDVGWNTDAGYTGAMFYGSVDRLYARPSAGLGGAASVASDWLLSQPEGTLTVGDKLPVALRAVPAPGGSAVKTAVRMINGSFPVIDAGSADAPDTKWVNGAVALVAGTCTDLTATANALKSAGAAAMGAYPGYGEQCAGTIDGSVSLPTLQARPYDAQFLLSRQGVHAGLATRESPSYMYDLVKFWDDNVPNGGTVSGTGTSVSALVEHYRGMGSTSADGMQAVEELIGWVPERGGVANIGLNRAVPFPSTVTHYISTGAEWERTVAILDATYGGEYARLYAPRRTYAGGTSTPDWWFGGPIGSRVSPLFRTTNGSPPPVRQDNELFLSMGAFTDAAGHMANSDMFSNEFNGKIYVDDELELDMWASVFMNTSIPAGDHHIRVVTETKRNNLFWKLSNQIRTTWRFDSDSPENLLKVLPMLGVDYRMPLSTTNTAPAGPYNFSVRFSMPDSVKTLPIVKRSMKISWNGGKTWLPVSLTCGDTTCKAQVLNHRSGHASLRVWAVDAAGRTLNQRIINAYAITQ